MIAANQRLLFEDPTLHLRNASTSLGTWHKNVRTIGNLFNLGFSKDFILVRTASGRWRRPLGLG